MPDFAAHEGNRYLDIKVRAIRMRSLDIDFIPGILFKLANEMLNKALFSRYFKEIVNVQSTEPFYINATPQVIGFMLCRNSVRVIAAEATRHIRRIEDIFGLLEQPLETQSFQQENQHLS